VAAVLEGVLLPAGELRYAGAAAALTHDGAISADPVGEHASQRRTHGTRESHHGEHQPQRAGAGVRCVSIFLDKNRRYIGKCQPKRTPQRTQRTPHLASHTATACSGTTPSHTAPAGARARHTQIMCTHAGR
jgi:hypothetical protein